MIDLQIKHKKDCTGCYACSNVCPVNCINMKKDEEGFWYPKVDYNICTECGLCIKVCPIINKTVVQNIPIAYACINKDEGIRAESSSGGIFTIIAEVVLDNGGIVFGAEFDNDFNVIHNYVEHKKELYRFRGSKYVQSKIGDTYKQVRDFLECGKQVLFCGTPCQVAGLKTYLRHKHDNLLCLDIICHGVPSPDVWLKYLSYQKKLINSTIQKINFRCKDKGWKGYSILFLFNNNIEYKKAHSKDLYMKAFLNNICLRPSCYDCVYKSIHRESDITLADFWGVQNILPKMDDDKGTSLIFINSSLGQVMLEKIKEKIIINKTNIDIAVKYNLAAIKSATYNFNRDSFFEELDKYPFDKLIKKYCKDSLMIRLKKKIKLVMNNNL